MNHIESFSFPPHLPHQGQGCDVLFFALKGQLILSPGVKPWEEDGATTLRSEGAPH